MDDGPRCARIWVLQQFTWTGCSPQLLERAATLVGQRAGASAGATAAGGSVAPGQLPASSNTVNTCRTFADGDVAAIRLQRRHEEFESVG